MMVDGRDEMARLTKRERAIKLCRSIGCPAVDTAAGILRLGWIVGIVGIG